MKPPVLLLTCALLAACLRLGSAPEAESVPASPAPVSTAPAAEKPAPADPEVRAAVERSLPYLEEHGVAWIEKFKCTSCHQVPVMMWTFRAAADRGLEIDEAKLDEWTDWVLADVRGKNSNNSDGMAQLILAGDARFRGLGESVAGRQKADGSWRAGGQLPDQRRPESETHRVSTAWAVLALASDGETGDAVERGRAAIDGWIAEEAEGESHEWLLVRLLYADRFGDEGRKSRLLDRLKASQNADGGWGWLAGEASDAFATGQSLYALALLAHGADDPAVERARRFLLDTQEADGSWAVQSTLGGDHGVTPTSRYWGTGWAAIGLLSTLPESS